MVQVAEETPPLAGVKLRTSNPPQTPKWRESRALGYPLGKEQCLHEEFGFG